MTRTRLRGLEIAGIQIGIEVPASCAWSWPEGPIADFACLPRAPEVHVGLRVAEISSADLGGECYALGAFTFEVARRGEDWWLGLSRRGQREQLATFDRDFRQGEMRIAREPARAGRFPLRTPFDQWIVLQRTIARGGLCLTGVVHESEDGVGIHLGPGAVPTAQTNRWLTPQTGLLPRDMVLIREEAGSLRGHPTPWCECPDGPRALAPRVSELWTTEESAQAYRELLDPEEAAELLVSHAVVPLCDEALLERVLANARRIAAAHRVLRFGEPASGVRPVAWPSAELANGYLPLRTTP